MLPPSGAGAPFANAILAEGSGSVGQFQEVAPKNDAALLKCLDQNYNAFGVAQFRVEDAGPARERTGGNAHRIAGAERPLVELDKAVGAKAGPNGRDDPIVHRPGAVVRAAEDTQNTAAVFHRPQRNGRAKTREQITREERPQDHPRRAGRMADGASRKGQ